MDSAATVQKARQCLQKRIETCLPFHSATLSVFQRKWQTLAQEQHQQPRGTLAVIVKWILWAYWMGYQEARNEPLITLGAATLDVPGVRSVVLGQFGKARHALDLAVVG